MPIQSAPKEVRFARPKKDWNCPYAPNWMLMGVAVPFDVMVVLRAVTTWAARVAPATARMGSEAL